MFFKLKQLVLFVLDYIILRVSFVLFTYFKKNQIIKFLFLGPCESQNLLHFKKHQVCGEGILSSPVLGCDGHMLASQSDSQFPLKHNELQQRVDGRGERYPHLGPTADVCVQRTHSVQMESYKPMQCSAVREISPPISCLPDRADVGTQNSFTFMAALDKSVLLL